MKKIILAILLLPSISFSQIENGMVAHYPFDGNCADVSSMMSSMTNQNSTFGPDRNGVANDAIYFNGTGYVSTNGTALKQQFPITVSYWVKLNSLSNVNVFFKTDNVFENHYGVWMNNLPTGGVSLSFGGGLGSQTSTNQRYFTTNSAIQSNVISANTWHHIVGIIRSYNDMDIYIDCNKTTGTYGGTGSTSLEYSSNGDSRIGGAIGGNGHPDDFYIDGAIDQFAFWSRELSLSEINFLCDTYNTLNTIELNTNPKTLVRIVDLLGREIKNVQFNEPLLYIYDDGSVEKILKLEE
jgi:hypothetical protein